MAAPVSLERTVFIAVPPFRWKQTVGESNKTKKKIGAVSLHNLPHFERYANTHVCGLCVFFSSWQTTTAEDRTDRHGAQSRRGNWSSPHETLMIGDDIIIVIIVIADVPRTLSSTNTCSEFFLHTVYCFTSPTLRLPFVWGHGTNLPSPAVFLEHENFESLVLQSFLWLSYLRNDIEVYLDKPKYTIIVYFRCRCSMVVSSEV